MSLATEPAPRLPARYYQRLLTLLHELAATERPLPVSALDACTELSLADAERCTEWALQQSGRSDLGLLLGARLDPASHDLLGLALRQCVNLDQAMRLAARYFSLLSPGFALRYTLQPESAQMWIFPRLPWRTQSLRFHLDAVLVATVNELRFLQGDRLSSLEVQIALPRPEDWRRYRRYLGLQPQWRSERLPGLYLGLPSAVMLQPRQSELALDRVTLARCEAARQRIRATHQLADWVRMMLRESQDGLPKLPELAQLLGIAPRSFARHLAAEGCSFRQLLDQQRQQRAQQQLRSGSISMTELALQLGYRDPANFSRAFRRAHQLSPRQWQGRQRGEPN